MQLQNSLVIVSTLYVAAIGIVGVAAGITSAAAWVSLSAVALLPAFSMLIVWSQRSQTVAPAVPLVRR